MTEKRYERLLPNYGESPRGILDLATYVVDHDITDMDGKRMIGEQRVDMIRDMAYNIGLGSNFSKRKYMCFGIVVGVVVTLGVNKITKYFEEEES